MAPSPSPHSALLVVGGGAAGLAAARSYRDSGGEGAVRIVSADQHPPYNRPPLSKDFLRGESEADALPLEEPSFYDERSIELVLGRQVVALDPERRSVTLDDGATLGYDTCVLATGSRPADLDVPGADHDDVRVLRSRGHAEALRGAAGHAGRALVVGSGFIGCEAVASLLARGLEVTMVSAEPVPQTERLGPQVGERIAGWLRGSGAQVLGGRGVVRIRDGRVVVMDDGSTWSGDLVVLAVGARPEVGLADQAGLATEQGRVLVDARMRSSAAGVLAAGDVALARNETAGRPLPVEHWGEALRMGEVAGATAAGSDDRWAQVPGFWTEIGERTLKYAAWGDGWDEVRLVEHDDGGFTAWYGQDGVLVGVLAHRADQDYERGSALVEQHSSFAAVTKA